MRFSLRTTAELQASEERFKLAQMMANIGSWDWNIQTGQLRWSETAKQIFGYTEQEFEETYEAFVQSVHPDDRQYVINSVGACVNRGKNYTIEHRIVLPDGSVRWVAESGDVVRGDEGRAVRMLGLVRNITQRKVAEETIKRYMAELERSNTELEDFAAIAAHDLQEPLRAISGFLQVIERKYGNRLDEAGKDFLRRSIKAAKRQQAMIQDLLTYAKITTRGAPFRTCRAENILKQALENVSVKIHESNARVTHDALPEISGDPVQLVRLFQNLIGNAIKFCDSQQPVVHVSYRREDGTHEFGVSDNGIGIEQEFHERIFRIFERLHASDQYGGSGLGLAACKKIVERHGGTIWLESVVGKGSTFYCLHENPRLWRGIHEEVTIRALACLRENALSGPFQAARYACGY